MLALTAKHADAWNTAWFREPNDGLRDLLGKLDAALDSEHRDGQTIRRTVGMDVNAARSADDLGRALAAFAALGLDDVIVGLEPRTRRSLDRLAAARQLLDS
jgi:alkanesulfonate monooxygenase SsuD/methylene tetrahydromethanopterin reductase-like flavin-dependent oxidoreductase (luciferase family)